MTVLSATTLRHAALLGAAMSFVTPAFAHVDASHSISSFSAGLAHPYSGLDHLLAMLAVGVLAAGDRPRIRWQLPMAFMLAMALGATLNRLGALGHGAAIETWIVGSVVILGLLVVLDIRLPALATTILVVGFGLLHGIAHGAELPQNGMAGLYFCGFLLATASLHLFGLAANLMIRSGTARGAVRGAWQRRRC